MKIHSFTLQPLAVLLALAGGAAAQSFNVDIGALGTPPSLALGAAASQPGTWNDRSAVTNGALALTDITGLVTTVTLQRTLGPTGGNFASNNPGTSGDDQALMDDFQDVGGAGASTTWVFANLAAGNYTVFTYAWASDSATFFTNVSVNGSANTVVGGAWPAGYVVGTTHAVNAVVVPAAGSITIVLGTSSGFGSFNGAQLRKEPPAPPAAFCFGDGTGTSAPCPCVNNGAAGNGCANSGNAAGANLSITGTASISADNLVLVGSGMVTVSPCSYFQGTNQVRVAFGDGLRCTNAGLIRLGQKYNSVAGGSAYPSAPGDVPIHIKGVVVAGDSRAYQTIYRDANPVFCVPFTFNTTNGMFLTWIP